MLWANGKGEFSRVENKTSISHCEWIISAPASCLRKLLRLFCKENVMWEKFILWYRINLWVSQTMLTHNQNLFLIVSYHFCLFGEFAKVFERKVWRVQVVHLHTTARALSSLSWCFQSFSTNLDFFHCLLCWDAEKIFTNTTRLLTSCVFLQQSEILHCKNKIDKEFW